MPRLRSPEIRCCLGVLMAGLLGCGGSVAFAEDVFLRLATGDQISGTVISETTNYLVLSNIWNAHLSIPQNQIISRSINWLPGIPADSAVRIASKKTETKPPHPIVPARPDHWSGEAQLGLNLVYGAKDQQVFYGRLKLVYQKPYERNPKKVFKNSIDYLAEYGKTEGVKSSDRMNLSDKTAFDLRKRWYIYDLVSGGYNHILKINAQVEAGPGLGYHLFTQTNFAMNVEAGLNYQGQFRGGDNPEVQNAYYRFGEDFLWKLGRRVTLVEKLELTPQVDFRSLRGRFESTLSYELWRNLSMNFTLLDFYDSEPADNVSRNELQIRSAIGVKF